jgi:hypothetical protein
VTLKILVQTGTRILNLILRSCTFFLGLYFNCLSRHLNLSNPGAIHEWEDDIKMDLERDVRMWTEFIWLRIGTGGGLLWTR